jgi:hypothetical protein
VNDDKFEETARDILVELRAESKHTREKVDQLHGAMIKQWEKLDDHSKELQGHDKEIGFLTKGFQIIATSIVGGIVSFVVWFLTHPGK